MSESNIMAHVSNSFTFFQVCLLSLNFSSILRTAFWVVMKQVVLISYQRLGKTYCSHLRGLRIQKLYKFSSQVKVKLRKTRLAYIFIALQSLTCYNGKIYKKDEENNC